jgi:hypothetical protein
MMEWINVKDKLPDHDQDVLCYDSHFKSFNVGKFEYQDISIICFITDTYSFFYPDYWMKLPNPPGQQENLQL